MDGEITRVRERLVVVVAAGLSSGIIKYDMLIQGAHITYH